MAATVVMAPEMATAEMEALEMSRGMVETEVMVPEMATAEMEAMEVPGGTAGTEVIPDLGMEMVVMVVMVS